MSPAVPAPSCVDHDLSTTQLLPSYHIYNSEQKQVVDTHCIGMQGLSLRRAPLSSLCSSAFRRPQASPSWPSLPTICVRNGSSSNHSSITSVHRADIQRATSALRAMSTTTSGTATPKTGKATPSGGDKRKMRILMLHGYTQSGPLFNSKTKALTKLLTKTLSSPPPIGLNIIPEFIYPTGPHRLRPQDIPGYIPPSDAEGGPPSDDDSDAWAWFRKNEIDGTYRGFEAGMATIASTIQTTFQDSQSTANPIPASEPVIDGIIGFSQGAAFASLISSTLEPSRPLPDPLTTPSPSAESILGAPADFTWATTLREANNNHPLKFCVIYSGFYTPVPGLQWLLENPKIQTPTAHFIGSLDTVVDEDRSQGLVERCVDPKVFVHPGGHYVPVAKQWSMALVGYVKEAWENAEKMNKEGKGQAV